MGEDVARLILAFATETEIEQHRFDCDTRSTTVHYLHSGDVLIVWYCVLYVHGDMYTFLVTTGGPTITADHGGVRIDTDFSSVRITTSCHSCLVLMKRATTFNK